MAVRNTRLSRKRKTQRKIRSRKLTGGRRKKSRCSRKLRKRTLSGRRKKIRSGRRRVRRSNKQIGGVSLDKHDQRIRNLQNTIDIISELIEITTILAGEDTELVNLYYREYEHLAIIGKDQFTSKDRNIILNNLVTYLVKLHEKYKKAYDAMARCAQCKKTNRGRFINYTDLSIANGKLFEKTQQVLKVIKGTDEQGTPYVVYTVREQLPYNIDKLKGYHPKFNKIDFLVDILNIWPLGKQIPTQ